MRVFVSYSRKDAATVNALTTDLERLDHQVWCDRELSGGQVWWDTILDRVRGCQLVVVALSRSAVDSEACRRELDYGRALGKPILSVRIDPYVSIALLPAYLAESQFVEYAQRNADSGLELARALGRIAPAGELPSPLPEPPTVPISYLTHLKDEVDQQSTLSFEQQTALVARLRARLSDPDDRNDVLGLLRRFRARQDLLASAAADIDALLGEGNPGPGGAPPGGAAWAGTAPAASPAGYGGGPPAGYGGGPPAGYGASPAAYGASPAGYGGGSPGGYTGRPPPPPHGVPLARTPTAGGPTVDGPWSTGVFVAMLAASLFCTPVGIIAGLIGLRVPAKKNQAVVLLVVGAISAVLGVMLWAAGQQDTGTSGF